MISKIAAVCAISSIASVDAFAMQTGRHHTTTRLQYRDLSQDEWFTTRELPSGPFGILPPPSSVSIDQDITPSLQTNASPYTFRTDQEPLIPLSFAQSSSHSPNYDLPASSTMNKDIELKKAVEIIFGRVAMLAAMVLIIEEIFTGESFPQQFLQLIGGAL